MTDVGGPVEPDAASLVRMREDLCPRLPGSYAQWSSALVGFLGAKQIRPAGGGR